MTTDEKLPHRVVTETGQSWMLTQDGYRINWKDEPRTLDELRAQHTLRPVEPITDDDQALLRETFTRAGRKTITTLAAAVEQVFHDVRRKMADRPGAHESYEHAKRVLTAGRPGSWESGVLIEVVMFGHGLNLAKQPPRTVLPVEELRRRGPNPRVDVECRQVIAEMLTRWVAGPDRYTEVAATLAAVVSAYADDTAGPDGWRAVADQWLQPGAMDVVNFSVCYRLFYSVSEHYDPDLP